MTNSGNKAAPPVITSAELIARTEPYKSAIRVPASAEGRYGQPTERLCLNPHEAALRYVDQLEAYMDEDGETGPNNVRDLIEMVRSLATPEQGGREAVAWQYRRIRGTLGPWEPCIDKADADDLRGQPDFYEVRDLFTTPRSEEDIRKAVVEEAAQIAERFGSRPAPGNDGCGTVILQPVNGRDVARAIRAALHSPADRSAK